MHDEQDRPDDERKVAMASRDPDYPDAGVSTLTRPASIDAE